MEMYSPHNEEKSVVAERSTKTVKNKIYKCRVNEYSNAYYSTIKMKPLNVKSSTYIDFNVEKIDENPQFKVGDHVRISKYKNIFTRGYTLSCFL